MPCAVSEEKYFKQRNRSVIQNKFVPQCATFLLFKFLHFLTFSEDGAISSDGGERFTYYISEMPG